MVLGRLAGRGACDRSLLCLSAFVSGFFFVSCLCVHIFPPPSPLYPSYPQVKPGMPYLDVIRRLRETSNLPISAYHVSGEYAMMKAAVERGWLDERAAVLEVRPGGRCTGKTNGRCCRPLSPA